MAMPHYNPNNPKTKKEECGSGKHWRAEIRESKKKSSDKKLVAITKEYIVDEFENLTGCDFDAKSLEEFGLWYSFDPDRGNFHIVPDGKVTFKNEEGESVSVWLRGYT